MIDTDASAYQLGATLLQQQDLSHPKEWMPVGYWSKTLSSADQNYIATERECYSVVWAITTLRPYIEGQKFVVRPDHDALRLLLTLSDPSGRLMRWRLRLSEFDFEIQYRPRSVHQVPDALSRLITPGSDPKRWMTKSLRLVTTTYWSPLVRTPDARQHTELQRQRKSPRRENRTR